MYITSCPLFHFCSQTSSCFVRASITNTMQKNILCVFLYVCIFMCISFSYKLIEQTSRREKYKCSCFSVSRCLKWRPEWCSGAAFGATCKKFLWVQEQLESCFPCSTSSQPRNIHVDWWLGVIVIGWCVCTFSFVRKMFDLVHLAAHAPPTILSDAGGRCL